MNTTVFSHMSTSVNNSRFSDKNITTWRISLTKESPQPRVLSHLIRMITHTSWIKQNYAKDQLLILSLRCLSVEHQLRHIPWPSAPMGWHFIPWIVEGDGLFYSSSSLCAKVLKYKLHVTPTFTYQQHLQFSSMHKEAVIQVTTVKCS